MNKEPTPVVTVRDLLHQTQVTLIEEHSEVSPVLLKLRLLASRLNSDLLEEWVRYESEGYPTDVEVPYYRKTGVHYTGTFVAGFNVLKKAPIPPNIIEQVAGKHWLEHQFREPLGEIEHLIRCKIANDKVLAMGGSAMLIPLLHDKVYVGAACHSVIGNIPENSLVTVQSVVRSKIMDLTIKFEAEISNGSDELDTASPSDIYNQITGSVVYGNVNIGAKIAGDVTQIVKGNTDSLIGALVKAGLAEEDAKELATIVSKEDLLPGDSLGTRTKQWISENIGDVARPVIINLLTKLVSSFHGLP